MLHAFYKNAKYCLYGELAFVRRYMNLYGWYQITKTYPYKYIGSFKVGTLIL